MNFVLFAIFLFANEMFILRYVEKITLNSIYLSLIYGLLIIVFMLFYQKAIRHISRGTYNTFFFVIAGFIMIFSVFLLLIISPYELDTERWTAIFNWNDSLFRGVYPYSAHTHLNGENSYISPFPFWQLLHFPFYLLGNVSYMLFVVLILLFFILYKLQSRVMDGVQFLLLLCLSPAFWFEIATKSDLMYNVFAVLIICLLLVYYPHKIWQHKFLFAFFIGLFACSRFFVMIPLLIFLFRPWLKMEMRDKIIFVIFFILGFLLPFVPFLFWNFDMLIHFKYSPIYLQTSYQTNIWLILINVVLALVLALHCKTKKDFYSYAALSMFCFAASAAFKFVVQDGFYGMLYEDNVFDLSYFSACFPFLLQSLSMKET
ncbi:MAG: hypothetical protein LBR28_05420 [Bacteroidales bacterium]|nr:hypothetical protein [Bacteroidales bacterium]